MRNSLRLGLAIACAAAAPSSDAEAQASTVAYSVAAQYTAEELDNLLAPVALYPDPILAQVLVAASYPDQVELAARHVAAFGRSRIDDQPWDISVRAVAHYAPVLNLMADRIDWTTALGQAYADQPGDVMDAVQSLRRMAQAHGNLVTTSEQQVYIEDRYVHIVPARPQVIYVPVYDPLIVYERPIVHLGVYRSSWSFGLAFPIGVWLNYDMDWGHRHVYYHGWDVRGRRDGWYHRSRPYIVVNNIYVNRGPTIVVVNRTVRNRRVDYDRFDRYNYVHRRVTWDRHRRDDGRRYAGNNGPSWDGDRKGDRKGDRDDDRRDDNRGIDNRGDDRSRNPSWDRSGRTNTGPRPAQTTGRDRIAAGPPTTGATKRTDAGRYQPRGNGSTAPRQDDRARATPAPRSTPQADRGRVTAQRSTPQADRGRVSTQRSTPQADRGRVSTQRSAPQADRGRVTAQRSTPQRAEPRAQPRAPRSEAKGGASGRSTQTRVAKSPSSSQGRGRNGN
jgi:Protein of unknown function (DUF3300)